MSNFGSFSYFQTFLSLGVEQRLQKLPKFYINDLRLLFHCNILIPRKCPRKTLFKTQCPPPDFQTFRRLCIGYTYLLFNVDPACVSSLLFLYVFILILSIFLFFKYNFIIIRECSGFSNDTWRFDGKMIYTN